MVKLPEKAKSSELKLLVVSVVLLAILITAIALYVLKRIETQTRHDIASTLQTVLATTHEAIDIWVDERNRDITSWALSPQLREAVKIQLDRYHDHEDLNGRAMAEIDQILQSSIMQLGYLGYIIIAPDFTQIASLLKYNLGQPGPHSKKSNELLPRVFHGETVITLLEPSDIPQISGQRPQDNLNMFSATPIRDENNTIIAALVFRFDPTFNFIHIPKLGRTGETGETYAFNKEGLLISESRFDDHLRQIGLIPPGGRGILAIKISDPGGNMVEGHQPTLPRSRQPLTNMAKQATSGKSGIDLDGYRDYRGVPVVGAWTWDNNLGIGLTTEIDYAEAYSSFKTTRMMILVLAFGIISLFGIFTITYTSATRKRLSILESLHAKDVQMTALVDNMVDGVITIDTRGIIQLFNPAAERIFGYKKEEMLGQNVSTLMPSPHKEKHDQYLQNYLNGGEAKIIGSARDLTARRKNGNIFPINLSVGVIHSKSALTFVGIIRDTSDKMLAEKSLRESEQRLSLALQALNGGTWDWNIITNEVIFSPQWLKTYGYAPDELAPHLDSWLQLIHPEDLSKTNALVKEHLDGKTSKYQCVYRIRHKSGEWRWSYDQGMIVAKDANNTPTRMMGVDNDVTDLKKVEEELTSSRNQLRQLANHVLNAQEAERRKICREIHDELGQALTVTKINLSWLAKQISPDNTDVLAKIEGLSKLTDDTINTMRRIASGLRPQILEDLGLQAAIESHSREFKIKTGLECVLNCDILNEKLDMERSFALFRIYQEAMTNVIRHARADKVTITLKKIDSVITLNITDNGKSTKDNMVVLPIRKSFGLLGMRERAAMFGGKVEIQGMAGQGTSVTITLPIHQTK